MWLVQVWKLTALRKAICIYTALVLIQKFAGYGVHDRLPINPFFQVFFVKSFNSHIDTRSHNLCFFFCNVDHECSAAISTRGAVNLWFDSAIKPVEEIVDIFGILLSQVGTERFVLLKFFLCSLFDIPEVGDDVVIT
jgi:hypothetical protein